MRESGQLLSYMSDKVASCILCVQSQHVYFLISHGTIKVICWIHFAPRAKLIANDKTAYICVQEDTFSWHFIYNNCSPLVSNEIDLYFHLLITDSTTYYYVNYTNGIHENVIFYIIVNIFMFYSELALCQS